MSDIFLSSPRPAAQASPPAAARRSSLAVIVVVVAAALGGVALSERKTIPAGTTIGGVDVGGMTRDEAAAAALPAAQARVARSIRLIGPRGEERVTGRALGARPLLDPALDVAVDAGPGERLLRHVGLGSAAHIDVTYRLGPVRAAELANRLDRRFGEQPQNADLVIDADDGLRLDLEAGAGNARRPGGAATRPAHAPGRARGAAAGARSRRRRRTGADRAGAS